MSSHLTPSIIYGWKWEVDDVMGKDDTRDALILANAVNIKAEDDDGICVDCKPDSCDDNCAVCEILPLLQQKAIESINDMVGKAIDAMDISLESIWIGSIQAEGDCGHKFSHGGYISFIEPEDAEMEPTIDVDLNEFDQYIDAVYKAIQPILGDIIKPQPMISSPYMLE